VLFVFWEKHNIFSKFHAS